IKLGGKEMQDKLLSVLAMIFRTDDVRVLDNDIVALDFVKQGVLVEDEDGNFRVDEEVLDSLGDNELKLIHRENFDDIIKIVKLQNYLEQPEEAVKEETPADEEARKLLEHMEKMRKKVEEKKRQQKEDEEGEIDISDIVSAVSSK